MKVQYFLALLCVLSDCSATIENRVWICNNGETVPLDYVCDRQFDCEDDSDENIFLCLERWRRFGHDLWTCDNGEKVPTDYLCNKEFDCSDGSDEGVELCGKRKRRAIYEEYNEKEKTFTCKDDAGEDVELTIDFVCDDIIDCGDGTDESSEQCALRECSSDEFQCESSDCIHASFRCDQEVDCLFDRSDEEDCDDIMDVCDETDFRCHNGTECFPKTWQCDTEVDCADGSDEWECPCDKGVIRCKAIGRNICVDEWAVCDGTIQCDDGSDEKDCDDNENIEKLECPPDSYRCVKEHKCIPLKLACDGTTDCQDNSDEGGICHANSCSFIGNSSGVSHAKDCEVFCTQTPSGAQCSCDKGYRLSVDGIHCDDIDECNEDDTYLGQTPSKHTWCAQRCINTPGGFMCGCEDGYNLDAGGYACKATGMYTPTLYFAVDNSIRSLTLRGPANKLITERPIYTSDKTDETVMSMSYSSSLQMLIWTEDSSSNLVIKNQYDDIVSLPLSVDGYRPAGVAVDWAGGNLFYTMIKRGSSTLVHGRVEAFKLGNDIFSLFESGKSKRSISNAREVLQPITILDNLIEPVAIAVCPHKGKLFIADKGSGRPVIIVSDITGNNKKNLVTGILPPTALVYDNIFEVLYWTSYNNNHATIGRVKIDGSNKESILQSKDYKSLRQPMSVSLFEGGLYISDKASREIYRIEIKPRGVSNNLAQFEEGQTAKSVMKLSRKSRMTSLIISHPVLQAPLKTTNPCDSKFCSNICVVSPHIFDFSFFKKSIITATCLCPRGLKLESGRLCKDISTTTTTAEPTTTADLTTESPVGPPKPKTCPGPGKIPNGNTFPKTFSFKPSTQFKIGFLVLYKCKTGYQIKDTNEKSKSLKCLRSGKWDSQPPVCEIIPGFETTTPVADVSAATTNASSPCDSITCESYEICKPLPEAHCECQFGKDPTSQSCFTSLMQMNNTMNNKVMKPTKKSYGKLIAVIVILSSLLIIIVVAFCRFYRRQSLSTLNVQYLRGSVVKGQTETDRKVGCVKKFKPPASISNPNYSSPSYSKRVTLKVDTSDSGLERTSSSSSSDMECRMPQADNLLLDDDNILDLENQPTTSTGLRAQLATIFNLRKTESTEHMLPKS